MDVSQEIIFTDMQFVDNVRGIMINAAGSDLGDKPTMARVNNVHIWGQNTAVKNTFCSGERAGYLFSAG